MSFWPFSSSYSNHSQLQKFLDSITDFSSVSVESLLDDRELQLEFLEELKNLTTKYGNKNSFQLPQLFLNDTTLLKSSINLNSDSISVSSSNNESTGGSSLSKNAREAKLLELLLQPHILNGFLDYIVASVDFFHKLALNEQDELDKMIHENEETDDADDVESNDAEFTDAQSHKDESEDGETKEERLRRCIQCSADVLSMKLWVISNRIIETPIIMSKLWLVLSLPNLLESSPSVSYLVQILDHLMDTNSIELLNFIRRQDDLVDTFLGKIDIPILMDFFLKIIQTDRGDSPTGILEVLSLQKLITKLVDILKPNPSQFDGTSYGIPNHQHLFKQTAATEFIKALVTISSNTTLAVDLDTNIGPNQLTRELASPEIINLMINDIILYQVQPDPKVPPSTNKHGISNCVAILIELIRKNNSDYDSNCGSYSSLLQNSNGEGTGEVNLYVMFQWLKDFEQNPPGPRDPVYLGDMMEIFSNNLDKLAGLMDLEVHSPPVNENEILGITRFKISELIAELLHCSNMILLNSRKVATLIHVRDEVRSLQANRLKTALSETITGELGTEMGTSHITDVTNGLDDVSLQDVHIMDENSRKSPVLSESSGSLSPEDEQKYRQMLEEFEYVESDDDEPTVSSENPFVGEERDEVFRANPCVGDLFKIKLIDLHVLYKIVTKFTTYPWHNFFHNVVFDLIQQIFNGKLNSYNSFLIVELFKHDQCDITNLIVSSFRHVSDPRPGYMGHLILVSEEVVKFTSLYKPALISPTIVEAVGSKDWEWFVNDVLLKTRELYNVILGADPEYLDDDDKKSGELSSEDRDHEAFGFDSATVGYMDPEPNNKKNAIILGDRSNHEEFVSQSAEEEEKDTKLLDVHIQNMTPNTLAKNEELVYDEFEENQKFQDFQDNDFLDNLSGSSSSDDEDDSHQLRRVPKHND